MKKAPADDILPGLFGFPIVELSPLIIRDDSAGGLKQSEEL